MLLRWTVGVYLWAALVLPPFLVDARAAAGLGALASGRTPCGVAVAGEAA